jgi:hypothetical protein
MIGVIVGSVAVLGMIGIIVNAYVISRRVATVLSDVEEIIHADMQGLDAKIETALTKIRIAEAKSHRE